MDNLINEVKQKYNSYELSKTQLNTLLELQSSRSKSNLLNIKSLSATLALLMIGLFSFYYFNNSSDNLTKIAREVIYNHKKGLPTEYLASSMADLNNKLTKLDFKIINPKHLNDYSTVGGRYCSIQGKIAAQIKIRINDTFSTLYQANYLDVDKSKLPFKFFENGTTVLVWLEQDILFAMATDKNTDFIK